MQVKKKYIAKLKTRSPKITVLQMTAQQLIALENIGSGKWQSKGNDMLRC